MTSQKEVRETKLTPLQLRVRKRYLLARSWHGRKFYDSMVYAGKTFCVFVNKDDIKMAFYDCSDEEWTKETGWT